MINVNCLPMLQFNQVQKNYNQKKVIEIGQLTLERNIYWLQGSNGSGKTTLLSMLAGMIPFKGDIWLDGVSLHENPLAYRRLVSFAEAEPLYPEFLTGTELVSLYRDIRKGAREQIDMLSNLLNMHRFISLPVGTYSSGMAKKLSLMLAFIGKPSLILLDEPLATLDEDSTQVVPELINAYHKEFKTGFIFSSHQPFRNYAPDVRRINMNDQSLQAVA